MFAEAIEPFSFKFDRFGSSFRWVHKVEREVFKVSWRIQAIEEWILVIEDLDEQ